MSSYLYRKSNPIVEDKVVTKSSYLHNGNAYTYTNRFTMEQPYMLPIPYCQNHACWCPGDLRSQGINRHGIDQIRQNILPLASEDLKWINPTMQDTEQSGETRSLLWLLMSRLLSSPGHQQPLYQLWNSAFLQSKYKKTCVCSVLRNDINWNCIFS